ncbi:MAG: DUF4428 domain-containing protein [Oscillospiraceae bacterium]|nr:DUF4428 domain-containing protein [Oscillospiraceae bacterium]
MGLFDIFKKKDCEICGKEVGMLGYKKLKDGEICKDCVKLLSPWFEDRRESTVEQIREQLAYREQNAKNLEGFTVSRTIGESGKIHIEEVNGVPTRFFVTRYNETIDSNPDIISFRDVISSVTDIHVRDEEMKQKDSEGKMVSYNPPRFKHHYDFRIKMEIRNNPYFDHISFTVNRSVVTIETVGGMGGIGGAAMTGFLRGAGLNANTTMGIQNDSYKNSQERRRYEEYRMMCEKIQQAVEDGKRGTAAAQGSTVDSLLTMISRIKDAPDLLSATTIAAEVARQATTLSDPDWERVKTLNNAAVAEAKQRFGYQEPGSAPAQEAPKPKFCPNCGAPYEGGKFCQSCGSRLS